MIPPVGLRQVPQTLSNDRVQLAQARGASTEQQVAQRIHAFVQRRFGGDYKRAFEHYAGGPGREVSKEAITRMLDDAGVTAWTVGAPQFMVADRMMDRFDGNRNGGVSFQEFQAGMRRIGVNI